MAGMASRLGGASSGIVEICHSFYHHLVSTYLYIPRKLHIRCLVHQVCSIACGMAPAICLSETIPTPGLASPIVTTASGLHNTIITTTTMPVGERSFPRLQKTNDSAGHVPPAMTS
jgi:hypothetical protein